jgi:hypothetical protein
MTGKGAGGQATAHAVMLDLIEALTSTTLLGSSKARWTQYTRDCDRYTWDSFYLRISGLRSSQDVMRVKSEIRFFAIDPEFDESSDACSGSKTIMTVIETSTPHDELSVKKWLAAFSDLGCDTLCIPVEKASL